MNVPRPHTVLQALQIQFYFQGVLVVGLTEVDLARDAVVEHDFGLLGLHAGVHGRVGHYGGFGCCGMGVDSGKEGRVRKGVVEA